MDAFDGLVDVVRRLREPGGCPWDRAQTPQTLRPYVVEEAFELAEALDGEDPDALHNATGSTRISEPLPLSCSSCPPQASCGSPCANRATAARVALPTSKTSPCAVM